MEYFTFDAIIIGSGAAGYAAACRLKELGAASVAVVTEDVNAGTSRNTGSDKQTYYKLGTGGEKDSVRAMAADLFACGAADGDTALCEAALSARWARKGGAPGVSMGGGIAWSESCFQKSRSQSSLNAWRGLNSNPL